MRQITIKTQKKKQIVDITEKLEEVVTEAKLMQGQVSAFVTHTTCCLTTADLDPGTDLDMLEAFEAMVPKLKYRHPHDPSHVGDHIMASLIGPRVVVPVNKGKLVLGSWQRAVLIEFNGPRERQIVINLR